MATQTLPTRRSILKIQQEYELGLNNELEKVMTAWAYIKGLPAEDPNSFMIIGGYHGEPFHGEGATDPQWWGGYCNHQNVLFPTWHRTYLMRLESAMQTCPGCEDVMQPFWDETDEYSTTYGIPRCLTDRFFTFRNGIPQCLLDQNIPHRGNTIVNPLASFIFTAAVTDTVRGGPSGSGLPGDFGDYSKPLGYQTVRYPLSGLVGNAALQQQTAAHNAMFPDYNTNVAILNANVLQWINNPLYYVPDANYPNGPTQTSQAGIAVAYAACLDAPNYNAFSNIQSAPYYSKKLNGNFVALEQPHNDIHLSVGGFDLPPAYNNGGPGSDMSQIPDANGDMGENDTAGLDPIFFFHHCNVDRMFWLWQKKNGHTTSMEIIADPNDPGTIASVGGNSQGPAYGQTLNETLTMQTELKPFLKSGSSNVYHTSEDCVNIETQLNYTYEVGSLDEAAPAPHLMEMATANVVKSDKKLHISGINRGGIHGSFIVAAYAAFGNEKYLLGHHAVLSRWKVAGCANCQTHLGVLGTVSLHRLTPEQISNAKFHVEIIGRESQNIENFGKFRTLAAGQYKPYTLEIK
jgi:tyrosinase